MNTVFKTVTAIIAAGVSCLISYRIGKDIGFFEALSDEVNYNINEEE